MRIQIDGLPPGVRVQLPTLYVRWYKLLLPGEPPPPAQPDMLHRLATLRCTRCGQLTFEMCAGSLFPFDRDPPPGVGHAADIIVAVACAGHALAAYDWLRLRFGVEDYQVDEGWPHETLAPHEPAPPTRVTWSGLAY